MPEAAGPTGVALTALAAMGALALLTWIASLVRRDASLVDRMWSVFFVAAVLVYYVRLPAVPGTRSAAVLVLVLAWALRLGVYITARNWGHGEDRRYQQIRARNQPHFAFKSLFLIFAPQCVIAWVISAPLFVAMQGTRPPGWIDALGCLLAAFGIVFEAVGDAQLAAFRADAANAGKVLDRGLWRYTRHPNYFGEACVWWGLGLLALGAAGGGGAWSAISPLLMTLLLLKVSGVALLEKNITETRPAYRDYVARTPAFVPRLPRGSRSPPR